MHVLVCKCEVLQARTHVMQQKIKHCKLGFTSHSKSWKITRFKELINSADLLSD